MEANDTSLTQLLREKCPVSLGVYMGLCLGHPAYGYYMQKVPFGRQGDFTTAPEISQMFGELVGACLIQSWIDQGQPAPFVLLELGPGRGTLMADILCTARKICPAFVQAAIVSLVETSPLLRDMQRQTLIRTQCKADWHNTLSTLPHDLPVFFVANEFFDALPIEQYVSDGQKWLQRHVDYDKTQQAFTYTDLECALPHPNLPVCPAGSIAEVCPSGLNIMKNLIKRITPVGAGLIIDYGYTNDMRQKAGWKSTLQAMYRHTYADPLKNPGAHDLTTHVNFTDLMTVAPFAKLCTQGAFLKALGIYQRAQSLFKATGHEQIFQDMTRLIDPAQMGALFRVMGVGGTQVSLDKLAGFQV